MAEAEIMQDEVVDISSLYFSRDNEENGIWYRPMVKGKRTEIEFLVHGPNSNVVAMADEEYIKARDEANEIEDKTQREEKLKELIAKRFSNYISDVRGANGKKLMVRGHEATKDDIFDIIYNAPAITLDLSRFTLNQDNFLGEGKNS